MLREISLIGGRMKKARLAAGLTGQKASECLDISGAYLSQIEKGHRTTVSVEMILRASKLYGVTTCYLMGCSYPPAFEIASRLYSLGFFRKTHYDRFWARMAKYAARSGFDARKFVKELGYDLDSGSSEQQDPQSMAEKPS